MAESTEKIVLVDPRTAARENTAAEMKQLRKKPLDRAQQAGGYFVTIDGTAHDAHGNPVEIKPEDLKHVEDLRALRGLPDLDAEPDPDAGTEDATPTDTREATAPKPRAKKK